jgi:HNH endonuclease
MLRLAPRSKSRDYRCVCIDGRLLAVHIVILETFVGPPPEPGLVGRHLNDIGGDNRLENLAWGTYQQNADDRRRNKGYAKAAQCIHGHEYTPENTWLSREGWRQCRTCHRLRERASKRERASV